MVKRRVCLDISASLLSGLLLDRVVLALLCDGALRCGLIRTRILNIGKLHALQSLRESLKSRKFLGSLSISPSNIDILLFHLIGALYCYLGILRMFISVP